MHDATKAGRAGTAPVQKTGPATGGSATRGGREQVKAGLRGKSFDEQAAALAPAGDSPGGGAVQLKPGDSENESSIPVSAEERRLTHVRLNQWQQASIDYAQAVATYLSDNWGYFIQKTGAPVGEAWSAALLRAVVGKGVGFVLGKGSAVAKAALIGSAAGPGGMLVGFVIDKLTEEIASRIIAGLAGKATTEEEASAKGADVAVGSAREKTRYFAGQADSARKEINGAYNVVNEQIDATSKSSTVNAISAWAGDELAKLGPFPLAGDTSLGQQMVHDWVLENTSTGKKAGAGVNKAAWESAKGVANRDLAKLWIYQSRKEWRAMGLANVDAICQKLLAEGATGTITFPKPANPKLFSQRVMDDAGPLAVSFNQVNHIAEGKDLTIYCEPDLESDIVDGAVSKYVCEWKFLLDFKGATFPPDLAGGKPPAQSPSFKVLGPVKTEGII